MNTYRGEGERGANNKANECIDFTKPYKENTIFLTIFRYDISLNFFKKFTFG